VRKHLALKATLLPSTTVGSVQKDDTVFEDLAVFGGRKARIAQRGATRASTVL
jgi:hypothetical protein